MTPYPAYKASGLEWLGEIPAHWEIKSLKYAVEINHDTLPENTDKEYQMQYIDIGNVSQEGLLNPPEAMTFGDSPSRARRITKKYDTIISTVRTYLKAIAYIASDGDNLIASTGFAVLTPTKQIYPKYLYYAVSSPQFIETVSASSVGVSYPAINSSDLGEIPIWFPKLLEEQCAIAAYLDHKTRLIDTYLAKKQQQIDRLQAYRTALINQAVTKGLNPDAPMKASGIEWLGEIPAHWEIVRLRRISKIKYGLGQPPKELDGGLPLIRATNIKRGKVLPDEMLYVDPKDIPYDRDPILKENDIIVVRSGAYTGDSAIIPKEYEGAVTGYDMVVMAEEAEPKFIAYGLLSHYILHDQIDLCRLRAAQPHLNAEELGNTLILLPPDDEQQEIVNFIETQTTKIDTLIAATQQQLDRLHAYRTALISAAVTGKIDVRNDKGCT